MRDQDIYGTIYAVSRQPYTVSIITNYSFTIKKFMLHTSPSAVSRPSSAVHRQPLTVLLVSILLSSCAVKPTASFTVPTQKFVAPVEVAFTNTTKFKAESYSWDFGDGSTSTEANPKHRYTQSGNHAVVLKATKGTKTIITKQMVQVTAPERCLVEIETDFGTMTAEFYNATPKP
jgi:PKD repeat protein